MMSKELEQLMTERAVKFGRNSEKKNKLIIEIIEEYKKDKVNNWQVMDEVIISHLDALSIPTLITVLKGVKK